MILASTEVNLFLWRPVVRKIATLTEIETSWSLVDLDEAHEVLDLTDAIEREQAESQRAQMEKK